MPKIMNGANCIGGSSDGNAISSSAAMWKILACRERITRGVAGAALMGTFLTSVAGVFFYSVIPSKVPCAPDWLLGVLFGAGGFAGMYCGARLQKFVPQKFLKLMLGLVITFLAGSYILQYFTR
jgi:uncharacterized membrane protein YfcA